MLPVVNVVVAHGRVWWCGILLVNASDDRFQVFLPLGLDGGVPLVDCLAHELREGDALFLELFSLPGAVVVQAHVYETGRHGVKIWRLYASVKT